MKQFTMNLCHQKRGVKGRNLIIILAKEDEQGPNQEQDSKFSEPTIGSSRRPNGTTKIDPL